MQHPARQDHAQPQGARDPRRTHDRGRRADDRAAARSARSTCRIRVSRSSTRPSSWRRRAPHRGHRRRGARDRRAARPATSCSRRGRASTSVRTCSAWSLRRPAMDLALAYELVRPLPDGLAEIVAKSRFSLAPGGMSKRALAWTGPFARHGAVPAGAGVQRASGAHAASLTADAAGRRPRHDRPAQQGDRAQHGDAARHFAGRRLESRPLASGHRGFLRLRRLPRDAVPARARQGVPRTATRTCRATCATARCRRGSSAARAAPSATPDHRGADDSAARRRRAVRPVPCATSSAPSPTRSSQRRRLRGRRIRNSG